MFSIREVVRVLNHRDEQAAFNLLAAYARANGATYISPSGVWFDPPTTASTVINPNGIPYAGPGPHYMVNTDALGQEPMDRKTDA